MFKKISISGFFFLFLILLAGCGQNQFDNISAFDESEVIIQEQVESSQTKEEITEQLRNANEGSIEALIANHFSFVESVAGEKTTSNVYGTDLFEVEELADLLAEIKQPNEISDYIDGQQILVYPDDFVILKKSEEIEDMTFIEVANEQFVRNNYSPNFLTTYLGIRLLESMFGNNWVSNRRNYCQTNDCYGGYSTTRNYNKGGTSTNRGMNSFRGGGPSSGK
ncbi:DUF4247 domain-containing protein [Gracilibacillus sp. YIM 98692]|uniref:DUF4247 domain-containing protein n=1 Tax=Gracilibacillus sp. YIM 98692 TaxID=2663532 RepID=UPI001F08DEBD|nr:DUF4247 domain-containing protein [Gracilibacillus sp. YIM 98692]